MLDEKKQKHIEYPSRWRLFLGFLTIAFLLLLSKKNLRDAAEVLTLGLEGKERLERKRAINKKRNNDE